MKELDYKELLAKYGDKIRDFQLEIFQCDFFPIEVYFKHYEKDVYYQHFNSNKFNDKIDATLGMNSEKLSVLICVNINNEEYEEVECFEPEDVYLGYMNIMDRFSKIYYPDASRVYMMKNLRNGYIKIGESKKPKYRERTLQSQEPEIELMWTYMGGRDFEKKLHNHFSDKRLRGEWFNLTDEDVNYVKSLKWIKND